MLESVWPVALQRPQGVLCHTSQSSWSLSLGFGQLVLCQTGQFPCWSLSFGFGQGALISLTRSVKEYIVRLIVQELCESRGGRPRLSVLTSLLVLVDVKIY